jgi:hypothetical protein
MPYTARKAVNSKSCSQWGCCVSIWNTWRSAPHRPINTKAFVQIIGAMLINLAYIA